MPEYSYLLGQYLGDGCVSKTGREGVFKLRIYCSDTYPEIMAECERAINAVMPKNKVGKVQKQGCKEVYSHSRHWPCLFPQYGPGKKHEREIRLSSWQQQIAHAEPRPLLRGLIHSDGCRVDNWVKGKAYPRYFFTNLSLDIQKIFGQACDQLGIEWRNNNSHTISVARRESVAKLDEFIGPKS